MDDVGLVRRERLAQDARRVRVSPTAQCRNLGATMAPQIEAVYRSLEAHIGAEFITGLYGTLDALNARLQGLAPPPDRPIASPRNPAAGHSRK